MGIIPGTCGLYGFTFLEHMQEVILEFRYLERMLALIVHGEWIAALEMTN